MKKIWSFVITGGPCSGKTTALSTIEQELSNRGYYVLVVPETATELISTGIRPFGNSLSSYDFQEVLMEKQLHKEAIYKKVAQKLPSEKVVILCDRGSIDNKSYMSEEEFQTLLKEMNTNEVDSRDEYEAVFHLVTAAKGAEEFYTLANNEARTETPEEARELDKRGIYNWTGHPHFRIIGNHSNFDEKLKRLMKEVYSALGEPYSVEIQRRYLIKKFNISEILKDIPYKEIDIVQTYLKSKNGIERRIRQRGQDGHYSYYYTEKRNISELKRARYEIKISQEDYIRYLSEMEPSLNPIVKKSICFVYDEQYFEVNFFNFSEEYALMQIEIPEEDWGVKLPDFIDIIKEVTTEERYRNSRLAKSQTLI